MKKLPFCTLVGGVLYATGGAIALFALAHRRDPVLLFIPLTWDIVMVAIGLGVVLRCDCARRAGLTWAIFCIAVSLLVGGVSFEWVMPQQADSTGPHRFIFTMLSVAFGLAFGIWQFVTLRSPTATALDADPGEQAGRPLE